MRSRHLFALALLLWPAGASAQGASPAKPASPQAPTTAPAAKPAAAAPPAPTPKNAEAPATPDAPPGTAEADAAEAARQAEAPGPGIRLEDAIHLALQNNERALKAPLRVQTAEGQLDRARTAFFPTLTAGGSGVWRATEDREGNNISTSGTVTLSQPILAPSAFPQYSQSSHQLESEKWGATQDKRQLSFDTAKSFLQVLTAERVLEAANRRVDRARQNLEDAEARAGAQLTSTNDATRSRIDLATALSQVAQAQGNMQKTRLQLEFLMGKKIEGTLAAPDRTTASAERYGSTPAATLAAAVDRRPDVRSSHERTEALRASAREPLYRLIPSINAQGQMRILPSPLATEKALDETVTLNLTWTIFDAAARYADRKTRLSQADSQALDEHLLKRSVETDVKIAIVGLRTARESYKIANDALVSAQKNVEETEILYRQGLAKALEVTDANSKRFDAEVNRATAKLQMEQAYLDLRNALGFGPIDDDNSNAGAR